MCLPSFLDSSFSVWCSWVWDTKWAWLSAKFFSMSKYCCSLENENMDLIELKSLYYINVSHVADRTLLKKTFLLRSAVTSKRCFFNERACIMKRTKQSTCHKTIFKVYVLTIFIIMLRHDLACCSTTLPLSTRFCSWCAFRESISHCWSAMYFSNLVRTVFWSLEISDRSNICCNTAAIFRLAGSSSSAERVTVYYHFLSSE